MQKSLRFLTNVANVRKSNKLTGYNTEGGKYDRRPVCIQTKLNYTKRKSMELQFQKRKIKKLQNYPQRTRSKHDPLTVEDQSL